MLRFVEKEHMRLKDLCEDERPREKMLGKGAASLSNAELLAIMLRTGTDRMNVVDVARELLRIADGSMSTVAGMSVEKLCSISGIGPGKAVTVAAAFELGRRAAAEGHAANRTVVSSPRDVYMIMIPHMRGLDHEECWVIYLNRANHVLGKEMMSSGGMDSTVLDIKVILRRALERKASSLVIVHNHPSGSALPGKADITRTALLKKALSACEIQLLDHVVVADSGWYSFADEQLVNEKF